MMRFRSLRVKLVMVYTLLILFAVELIGAYFVQALTSSLVRNQAQTARTQAQLMATLIAPELAPGARVSNSAVSNLLQSVPQFLNGTVYVLNQSGYVMYTTAGGALVGQKRIDSVATQALLHHTFAQSVRYDPLSKSHLLAVAVPVTLHGTYLGVLEYVLSIQSTYETIHQATTIFYTGSIAVLAIVMILGAIVARALTRPVMEVTRQAEVMARGDFSQRLEAMSNDEIGDLVASINHLADELEEAIAANRLEQERLRAVITSMGEGVIVLDSSGQVLMMNRAARQMLSQAAGGEEEAIRQLELDRLMQGDVATGVREVRVIGNTIFHVILTSVQRRGQVDGYVAVVRDVTEQEKLDQARRDFVSNVSHELRTPLTTVKSYLEVMRDLGDDEAETKREFLEVIARETDRMVRLTRDLLLLSGLDRGGPRSVEMRAIPVHGLLEGVVERFQLQAAKQELSLRVHLPQRRDVCVYGDEDMVNRVLDNVLSNALKYTPPGGRIEVRADVTAQHVTFIISDTGIGIPPEDLPHVFERFYRVEKGRSRRGGGTGLGLALAREMVERMGGEIRMESEPQRGTTVYVTLRRAEEDAV
ncbi:PAS/PAC sensor signal transduction histidine kinase [Alicyclobacillus acidocaldarius subsp. acidocaldarius DSM 446]|uniref:histidine kinase n=2 Tax=Alicyclobacillus acidocaldarius TaxID=405212 RepID=C8WV87_ALIAD|nr:PAS/PAC sensor signal transduction histidine kinase [Alicyclobacillus acidocaldarius subsp. acidocaldarius DSM 446]